MEEDHDVGRNGEVCVVASAGTCAACEFSSRLSSMEKRGIEVRRWGNEEGESRELDVPFYGRRAQKNWREAHSMCYGASTWHGCRSSERNGCKHVVRMRSAVGRGSSPLHGREANHRRLGRTRGGACSGGVSSAGCMEEKPC